MYEIIRIKENFNNFYLTHESEFSITLWEIAKQIIFLNSTNLIVAEDEVIQKCKKTDKTFNGPFRSDNAFVCVSMYKQLLNLINQFKDEYDMKLFYQTWVIADKQIPNIDLSDANYIACVGMNNKVVQDVVHIHNDKTVVEFDEIFDAMFVIQSNQNDYTFMSHGESETESIPKEYVNMKETLKQVYPDKDYKTASAAFKKIRETYSFEELMCLFKKDQSGEYIFEKKDIQLLKFIKAIYDLDPSIRLNAKYEKLTLKSLLNISEGIKKIEDNKNYNLISNVISTSLRSKEFKSITAIYDLVKKISLLFQYACENDSANFGIYSDLNDYLDILINVYSCHRYYGEFVKSIEDLVKSDNVHTINLVRDTAYSNSVNPYSGIKEYVKSIITEVKNGSIFCELILDTSEEHTRLLEYQFEELDSLCDFVENYIKFSRKANQFWNLYTSDIKNIATKISTLIKLDLVDYKSNKNTSGSQKYERIDVDVFYSEVDLLIEIITRSIINSELNSFEIKEKSDLFKVYINEFLDETILECANGTIAKSILSFDRYLQTKYSVSPDDNTRKIATEIGLTAILCQILKPEMDLMNLCDAINNQMLVKYKYFKFNLNNIDFALQMDSDDKFIINKLRECFSQADKDTSELLSSPDALNNKLLNDMDQVVGNYLYNIFDKKSREKCTYSNINK